MADDLNPVTRDGIDENEAISVNLARLATAAEELAIRQRPVEQRSKLNTWALALVVVMAAAIVVMGLQNRQIAQAAADQAFTNATLTAQIKDCLDPSGQCYKDSRARSGDVERRVLADQAEKARTQLEAVCDLYDTHGAARPVECGPDQADR
jgi:hypothetical protein